MNQIRSGADAVIFEAVFSVAHSIVGEENARIILTPRKKRREANNKE